ncbi:hypothetical protein B0H10DRAFT_697698 [Mycena sp. CBHHK59/15]|nr:hypothetical protein B0H10DRAFT_697698 [Mycena sp. CBHHK59/15]
MLPRSPATMGKTKTGTEIPNSKDTLIDRSDTSYTTLDLGVWRVLLATKDPDSSIFLGFKSSWNTVAAALPLILRFLGEIYHLRPDLVLLFFLLKLWSGVESVLMLYVSSRLLRIIEVGLAEGRPDVNAICQAIMARLLCVTFTATTTWAR